MVTDFMDNLTDATSHMEKSFTPTSSSGGSAWSGGSGFGGFSGGRFGDGGGDGW